MLELLFLEVLLADVLHFFLEFYMFAFFFFNLVLHVNWNRLLLLLEQVFHLELVDSRADLELFELAEHVDL